MLINLSMARQPVLYADNTYNPPRATARKIKEMRLLQPGWYFGHEKPISEPTIQTALAINEAAIAALLYKTSASPGENGEVTVAISHDDYYMEVIVEADGTITTICQFRDQEPEYREGLSLDLARKVIRQFGEFAGR